MSPGLVEKHSSTKRFQVFVSVLQDRVEGLRKGLNITSEGKLKTYEEWLGTFYLVNDLITKMKLSDAGRKIINGQILDNWQQIKLHSEQAKNRHAGMIKIGQWTTTPSIKGIGSDQLWDCLL